MPRPIPDAANIELKPAFVERYKSILGDRYDKFYEYSFSYLRESIRINTLKADVQEMKERLEAQGFILELVPWCKEGFFIQHESGRRDIGCTIEHQLGYYYIQEAASMIPPVVLEQSRARLSLTCAPHQARNQLR